jgi:signal transduction histidine kinase
VRALRREPADGATIVKVKLAALGLLGLGVVLAAITGPLVAGAGVATVVLLVGAGLTAVGVGAAAALRRSGTAFGLLLAAAGCLWFATQWDTPEVGSAALFTVGLVSWGAFPAVAAHAAFAYPSGHLPARIDRVAVTTGYVVLVGVFGLAPALVFDPLVAGCRACPDNLLQFGSAPAFVEPLRRGAAACATGTSAALALLCVVRIVRSSSAARRTTGFVLGSAGVLLLATTAMFVRSIVPGAVPLDQTTRLAWWAQGISLLVLSLAVVLEWIRLRRSRSRMARYALDIGATASGGDMRDLLAAELRDPTLEVAYPLDDGRLVDAAGAPTTKGGSGRATTALVRDGSTVAVLTHRAELSDDYRLVEDVVSAARLRLDNERLSAQARAQVAELAASQLRIIDAGEAERRRLERDLHDGAQQRLVTLMLTLRLARATTRTAGDCERIDTSIGVLRDVIAAVRRLAAGIYPSVLAEAGLRGGLAALAEESPSPVRVLAVPAGRLPATTETAAYLLVSGLARCGAVAVSITVDEQRLLVDVDAAALPESLTDIEDRIGALGGTLTVNRSAGRPTVQAELPCG